MLGHRPLSAVRFIAVRHLTNEFPLDLASAPPHSLLLLLVGLLLSLFQFLYPLCQLQFLLARCIELGGEDSVGEVQLVNLFEIELGGCFDVALELIDTDGLIFEEFLLVPFWVSFVSEPLAFEHDQVHLLLLHHKLN